MALNSAQVDALVAAGCFTLGKIRVHNIRKGFDGCEPSHFTGVASTNPNGEILSEPRRVLFSNLGDDGRVIMRSNDIIGTFLGSFSPDEFKLPELSEVANVKA